MSNPSNTGRTAGVTGTYGTKRKGAEKTIIAEGENNEGGPLGAVASSIYSKAVKNGGGSDTGGDTALRTR